LIKKVAISVFILAVLAQSGFVALSSALRVVFHKLEMYETIETALMNGQMVSELDVFTETQLKQAEWEHAGEFELNGEKYDVLEVMEVNGVKTYRCVNDTKETILVNQLDKSGKVSYVLDEMLKKIQFNSLMFSVHPDAVSAINGLWKESYSNLYAFSFLKFNFRPPTI
jgi:hypothetical protein